MGGMSIQHWAIVALVLVFLFWRAKFSDIMVDIAKGFKEIKKIGKDEGNEG